MKAAVWIGAAAVLVATPTSAESWNAVSRNQTKVFLADVDSISAQGEVTSVKVAAVLRTGEAGDHSHSIEIYQFQCAPGKWRTAGMAEHGPDGAEVDTYPEVDAAWEDLRADTLPDHLKRMACDGDRTAAAVWPTVAAFIDAGRP